MIQGNNFVRLRLPTLLFALVMLASACSYSNTDASTMSCVFNGGPLDSKDFREFKDPGSGREAVGVSSDTIDIPIRLLTYQISQDPSTGDTRTADSLEVNVGGMLMQFEPTVNMKFNTGIEEVADKDKPVVCTFYETHLKAFNANDFNVPGGNWQFGFLGSRVRPSIDVAGVRAIQTFDDPIKMYFNIVENGEELGYRDRAAAAFSKALSSEPEAVLGGEFFCSPEHAYKSDECGDVRVILPQPDISSEDLAILAAPQRARTEANARIAEADEAARQAQQVAEARTLEAKSAQEKADADEKIAQEEARTVEVATQNEYAWCRVLRELGERCWLVAAAENGSLPQVLGEQDDTSILISPEIDDPTPEPEPEPEPAAEPESVSEPGTESVETEG